MARNFKITGRNTGEALGDGLGKLGKAFLSGGSAYKNAEADAFSKTAMGNYHMAGVRKYNADADEANFDLGRRQTAADALFMTDKNDPEYAYRRALADAGAGKIHDATQGLQQSGRIVAQNMGLAELGKPLAQQDRNIINQAAEFAAGKAYLPYKNVGDTGIAIDTATGSGNVMDQGLRALFGNESQSKVAEKKAQAANAYASAGQHRAQADLITGKLGLLDSGGGSGGKPLTPAQLRTNAMIDEHRKFVEGLPPTMLERIMGQNPSMMTAQDQLLYNKIKLGQNPKFGEPAVPERYTTQLGLDPETINAVSVLMGQPMVKKPWFGAETPMTSAEKLAYIKDKVPATKANTEAYMAAASKNPSLPANPAPANLPAGAKQIGTSGGKPVYQDASGRKFMLGQ